MLGATEKNSNKVIEMFNTVHQGNTLKKTTLSKWIKAFNKICEGCKDNLKSEYLFTSCDDKNIEFVRPRTLSDGRMTVQMIAD